MNRVLHVHRAWGPMIEAPALVMREGFSPRYDLDRLTGVISRIGHSAHAAGLITGLQQVAHAWWHAVI